MDYFQQQLYYWTHMLDDAFGSKSILTEGKHWPEDYIKTAYNTIKASQLGQQAWYTDEYISQDLNNIVQEFGPLSHKNSNLGFFATIIRWFIQYSGDSHQKYQEFLETKLDKIIRTLQVVLQDISPEEKDKLKKAPYDEFEKIQEQYDEKIKNSDTDYEGEERNEYDIYFIKSYEQLNEMFGGDKTGYKGESEWCHTNGQSTYDSWTSNKTKFFFVLAKNGWENITPPPPETTNAYDEYGTSLIAILVSKNGKLLNATLRWNHNIDPSQTVQGTSTDRAFLTFKSLSDTVGMDVKNKVLETLKNEAVYSKYSTVIYEGDNIRCVVENKHLHWVDNNDNEIPVPQKITGNFVIHTAEITGDEEDVDSADPYLSEAQVINVESLENSPFEVDGKFEIVGNLSLKDGPKKVKKFVCFKNNLIRNLQYFPEIANEIYIFSCENMTSLVGITNKAVRTLYISSCPKLVSLESAPIRVSESLFIYNCKNLKEINANIRKAKKLSCISCTGMTSLKGAPKEIKNIEILGCISLKSFVGLPNKIDGNFIASDINSNSLIGAPEYIGGDVSIKYFKKLNQPEGFPKYIGGDLIIDRNNEVVNNMVKMLPIEIKGEIKVK